MIKILYFNILNKIQMESDSQINTETDKENINQLDNRDNDNENTDIKQKYEMLMEIYNITCENLSSLQNSYKEQSIDLENLKIDYDTLRNEHEKLKKEFTDLKYEYSENTVIQSMNNMKLQYEELIETTVPKFKYENLYEKWKYLDEISNASKIILNHSLKFIEKICDNLLYGSQRRLDMHKLQSQLVLIKELLDEK